MTTLRVALFGTVTVDHVGLTAVARPTRGVQALLAYLLLNRSRAHPREVIAGLFWGDSPETQARNALSTMLWRLRQVLEPTGVPRGAYLLGNGSGEIAFNQAGDYWLDVAEFEERAVCALAVPPRALDPAQVEALEQALALYTGDLLPGFYEDWALRERERLRRLHLDCLAHLMQCHEHRGDYVSALAHGRRILELDPLREETHRGVMWLLAATGQRARALRQYRRCREVLEKELGVPPMPETQALLAQISNRPRPASLPTTGQGEVGLTGALAELRQAQQAFDQAQARLLRATDLVERLAWNGRPSSVAAKG